MFQLVVYMIHLFQSNDNNLQAVIEFPMTNDNEPE